jgi:hypothetical protein
MGQINEKMVQRWQASVLDSDGLGFLAVPRVSALFVHYASRKRWP